MQNKKSFILHLDSLSVLDDLNNEQIAELFIAMRDYNLGKEIKLSGLMKAVFTSFKNQFDRDLDKYNSIVERNKKNGQKGGRPRKDKNPLGSLETQRNPKKPKKADNDNDSGNDNDNDNKKENIFNFKNSLLNLGIEKQIVEDWLKVRKSKNATNTETAFNNIVSQIEKSGRSANECIRIAVEKSWSGFNASWLSNISEEIKETKFTLKNYDIPTNDYFGYNNQDLIDRCKQGHYKLKVS